MRAVREALPAGGGRGVDRRRRGARRAARPADHRRRPGRARRPERGRARGWRRPSAGRCSSSRRRSAPGGRWTRAAPGICDVTPLHGESIEADLARRDFTVNAMAVPAGRAASCSTRRAGVADLEARLLRVLGGPSVEQSAYADDPLRPLRLARLATELGLRPTPTPSGSPARRPPRVAERRGGARLRRAAPARRRAERVIEGLELCRPAGPAPRWCCPSCSALHGVEQSHFHHLDVYGHTLEVLRQAARARASIRRRVFGELAEPLDALMREPLADELDALAGAPLRRAAARRRQAGHARRAPGRPRDVHRATTASGAELVRRDLRAGCAPSERLRQFLAGLTRNHLVLGFLVHERPLDRRTVYRYLRALRARGGRGHAALLRRPAGHAREERRRRDRGAPRARARADGRGPGLARDGAAGAAAARRRAGAGARHRARARSSGALLAQLREARFAGEATTAEEALELARRLRLSA